MATCKEGERPKLLLKGFNARPHEVGDMLVEVAKVGGQMWAWLRGCAGGIRLIFLFLLPKGAQTGYAEGYAQSATAYLSN